jgi:hypothetical protein
MADNPVYVDRHHFSGRAVLVYAHLLKKKDVIVKQLKGFPSLWDANLFRRRLSRAGWKALGNPGTCKALRFVRIKCLVPHTINIPFLHVGHFAAANGWRLYCLPVFSAPRFGLIDSSFHKPYNEAVIAGFKWDMRVKKSTTPCRPLKNNWRFRGT